MEWCLLVWSRVLGKITTLWCETCGWWIISTVEFLLPCLHLCSRALYLILLNLHPVGYHHSGSRSPQLGPLSLITPSVFKVIFSPTGFPILHHPDKSSKSWSPHLGSLSLITLSCLTVVTSQHPFSEPFPHFLPRWLLHHSPPQVHSSVAGHHGCLFLTSHTLRLLCSSFPFSSSPSQCNFLQVSSDGRLNALCFWSLFTSDDFFWFNYLNYVYIWVGVVCAHKHRWLWRS